MPRGSYDRSKRKGEQRKITRQQKVQRVDNFINLFERRKNAHLATIAALEKQIQKHKELAELAQSHIDHCLEVRERVAREKDYMSIPILHWHIHDKEKVLRRGEERLRFLYHTENYIPATRWIGDEVHYA